MRELTLMKKEASHCYISTDATYSLLREVIQKNNLRVITHMEKRSYLMYFFPEHLLPLCKQCSPSALLSSSLGADSPHTNLRCHWSQLTPGR